MVVYSVFIISKSGGLIYSYDHTPSSMEIEKTFSYPLDLKMDYINQRVVVTFGQRDGIRGKDLSFKNTLNDGVLVGYSVLGINGEALTGRIIGDRDVLTDILANETNYPVSIKLGIPKLSANEKIVLASMFHSMYAIAALQLSGSKGGTKYKPPSSSGIEVLETENFKLNCFQTLTGVKFIVISDLSPSITPKEALLRKIYEVYADYALKNPFYSLDMPIRCELFDVNLHLLLEQAERTGINNI